MRKIGFIGVLVVAIASSAQADHLVTRDNSHDLLAGVFTFSNGSGNLESNFTAGLLGLKVDGVDATGYCVSPFYTLSNSWNATDATPFTNNGPVNNGLLWNLSSDQVRRIAYLADLTVGSPTQAATVQLAIWSIEFEGHGITIGGDYGGYSSSVNSLLTSASSAPTTYSYQLLTPTGGSNSQSIILHNGGDNTHVETAPEPITMTLGLAGIGVFVRRRMRKPA